MFKRIHFVLKFFGFDPLVLFRNLRGIYSYVSDYLEIRKQKNDDVNFGFGKFYPYLLDKTSAAGNASSQYFIQDLHVASLIYKSKPIKHLDIGSRIDGFVAHVAVFREIEILDIRSLTNVSSNIKFRQVDLMQLPVDMIGYCDSLSALHSIEHFGLGRYGDPINYGGHVSAIDNIHRILKLHGKFYFSVPIGRQRIEFNAHRIFNLKYLLSLFKGKFELKSFSYMDDAGNFQQNVIITDYIIEECSNFNFGLGIFELVKI